MKENSSSIRIQADRSGHREHSVPMYVTSSFMHHSAEQAAAVFAKEEEGYLYSRFQNPNTEELIAKFCKLENATHGVATASGMAANFYALAAHLESGDHVIGCTTLFGNTLNVLNDILPKWGVESTLVQPQDYEGWVRAIRPNTKMIFIETPTNPGLEIIDLERLSHLAKAHNIILAVDNCFATPILQKPITFGADLVIHSATKWADGQGRVLGGIVVGSEEHIAPIHNLLRRTGASMSPFNAWTISKSLETLGLRMERHSQNALVLAQMLEGHPRIRSVRYPFLEGHPQRELAHKQMSMGGGIVTIDVRGGRAEAFQLINGLEMVSITANLGDTRTIITHPSSTTHSRLSAEEKEAARIWESTVRISVGLEDIEDLIEDFDRSLNQVKG